MITDLRARLKAVADKPQKPQNIATCEVIEASMPAPKGLGDVTETHLRRLGFNAPWDAKRALFLDTETTGLRGAGTVAFLVGVGWLSGDQFIVRQYLMRDYPEEADLLAQLAALLPGFDCIISFNGKSFDVPLLADRFTMQRLRVDFARFAQLDLLHAARRTWRLRLGSCTLGRVEELVLGIPRDHDLPGAEVPERYFRFLKTGERALLDDILAHNLQDVRTLALLLSHLARVYASPDAQQSMLDVFSAGRALERYGEAALARRCFQVASVSELSRQARFALAQSYRKQQDFHRAAEVYRGLIARGEGGADAYTALAVLLEHRLGDAPGALLVTERAMLRFAGVDKEAVADLERRRVRLKRKIYRSGGV
ncbi:MAG: ribonuclease H-like domain-containing protein [Oscillospiraceae bacterium]|jgi:uncharacterized protein YprB with RNaseH-like and TPR domain|nr:ribonuclease H-like domain-containing protein [Oscillospiraceae bacterium]